MPNFSDVKLFRCRKDVNKQRLLSLFHACDGRMNSTAFINK